MYPETTTGTTLEILAPYLPYGIDVQIMDAYQPNTRRQLASLFYDTRAHVHKMSTDGSRIELGNLAIDIDRLLPVLRSFADLCTPLADGTVPTVEIRKLWGLQAMDGDTEQEYNGMVLRILQGQEIGKYAMSIEVTFDDIANALDYLRRHHFAVGLEPHQYIRKA